MAKRPSLLEKVIARLTAKIEALEAAREELFEEQALLRASSPKKRTPPVIES